MTDHPRVAFSGDRMAERTNKELSAAEKDNDMPKVLSLMVQLNDHLKLLISSAEKAAPYRHRKLIGEKPLEDDKAEGPRVLLLTAAEIAQ